MATNRRWAELRNRFTSCLEDLLGRAELTVENKSKQPSLLMTQYTSGRRGPFPVGWKREEQNWLDQTWLEVRLDMGL